MAKNGTTSWLIMIKSIDPTPFNLVNPIRKASKSQKIVPLRYLLLFSWQFLVQDS
jgi:hypothetical protein